MHLPIVLGELVRGEALLASACGHIARVHADEADVHHECTEFRREALARVERLAPHADRIGEVVPDQPDRLYGDLFTGSRRGAAGMLRDVRDLWVFASSVEMTWTVALEAAAAARDAELKELCQSAQGELEKTTSWLKTKLKNAAPQALLVDPAPVVAARTVAHKKLLDAQAFRPGSGVYTFLAALVALVVLGIIGQLSHKPFLFPSLGPIVYLLFDSPLAPGSSPRNTIYANAVALLAGYGALAAFGLTHHQSVTQEGLTASRTLAAALSVAVTGLVAHLLKTQHAPAGATTLIVSLGIVHKPADLVVMFVAIVMLAVVGVLLNRVVGVRMPPWSARTSPRLSPE